MTSHRQLFYSRGMDKEEIKRVRRWLGLTQQQVAEKFGVHHTLICHWESGHRKPTADDLKELQVMRKQAQKLVTSQLGR